MVLAVLFAAMTGYWNRFVEPIKSEPAMAGLFFAAYPVIAAAFVASAASAAFGLNKCKDCGFRWR